MMARHSSGASCWRSSRRRRSRRKRSIIQFNARPEPSRARKQDCLTSCRPELIIDLPPAPASPSTSQEAIDVAPRSNHGLGFPDAPVRTFKRGWPSPGSGRQTKSECYARGRNNRAGAQRRAGRKVSVDAGRRICARRNGAHTQREAWGSIGETGDRNRAFQSEARRRRFAAAEERQLLAPCARAGETRPEKRRERKSEKTFRHTITGRQAGIEEGAARRGFASSVIASGAHCGEKAK